MPHRLEPSHLTLRTPALLAAVLAGSWVSAARGQGIPPVNGPVCVSGCPEDGPAGSSGTDRGSGGGPNLFDRIAQAVEASRVRHRQEAHQKNEAGVAEFKRGNYAEALRLFRQAEGADPDGDPVIRQNVKNAESALAAQRAEREREEKLRKEQEEYRQGARKLAALMPPVRVAPPGGARGERSRVPPLGFPPERWRAYLEAQQVVDVLYEKVSQGSPLTDAEAQTFYEALRRRNALWAEAQAGPRDEGDREALRLSVPVRPGPPLSRGAPAGAAPEAPDRRAGEGPSRSDALTHAFVADHLTDQQLKVGDRAVADWLQVHGEAAPGRFERLVGVARVVVKAHKGGAPEAGAELADFGISRLPEPLSLRAELAKEGGRVYSDVAFRALDRFMIDAMAAVGQDFDPVAFRQRVKAELSAGQKGASAWATGQ
jgi:tetratricopeptide (TPR) repeat protein